MTIQNSNLPTLPQRSKGFQTQPEVLNPVECTVHGEIPAWISGILYRAGPGTFDIDLPDGKKYEIQHWFDGLAQIHRFEIENGKVSYMSRNTASGVEKSIKQGQERSATFGQDICQTVFAKTASVMKDVAAKSKENGPSDTNINVVIAVQYPGVNNPKVVTVLTDANRLVNLDWKTLEPQELYNYSKFNSKFDGMLSAAHPCVDPNTNETWQFVTILGPNPGYNVFTISDANPEGELVGFVPAKSAYIHSSFLTENYYVLCVPPYYINGRELMEKRNVAGALHFDEDTSTQFFVFDRRQRKHVATYEAPAFFFFHSINAYDNGTDLTLDVIGYAEPSVVQALYFANVVQQVPFPKKLTVQDVRRYTLSDVSSGTESPRQASMSFLAKDVAPELPRVNDANYCRPYTYFYAANMADLNTEYGIFSDSVSKTNVKTGESWVWKEADCRPGEPVFIADPQGHDEDDGVLLSVVLDERKAESFLVVLSAKTMQEIARAQIHSVVPFGFHGAFMSELP
ncbi:hypothetical protein NQZ79_g4392 [Umbelopsis isabellina]|nr:hypothetical protein NQZ79_g4392 [Umbelopsis isabellina]